MGAADLRLDMAAGLAVAAVEGCDPAAAPALLRAIQDGLLAAVAKRRRESRHAGDDA
jgi:hypothetical protein